MIRKLMFGFTLAAVAGLAIGCTEAKKDEAPKKTSEYAEKMKEESAKRDNAGNRVKEAVDKGVDKGKEVATEGKDALVKKIEEYYPKFEDKIKSLTGDASTKAKDAFEALKKQVTEFKAAPADKLKEMGDALTVKFEELKKTLSL